MGSGDERGRRRERTAEALSAVNEAAAGWAAAGAVAETSDALKFSDCIKCSHLLLKFIAKQRL